MAEQTTIPAADAPTPATGQCHWCLATTSRRVEIEPARWGTDRLTGVKVMKKAAIEVFVCDAHDKSLARSESKVKKEKPAKGIVIR